VGWVGDVAVEIDRLVVGMYERAGSLFAVNELAESMKAHPALLNGFSVSLFQGPMDATSVGVIYPYLPDNIRDLLIQNNVDEGIVRIDGDRIVLTDEGTGPARAVNEMFESAASIWDGHDGLGDIDDTAVAVVAHGRTLPPPILPSAFAVAERVTERPTQAERVFRHINAIRYWRADAHRAAWSEVGLSVLEAHALNRLWDIDRDVVRVGQGEERPGRRGVAGLTERGYATDDAITELGRKAREAIEADTDARTEPIYAPLDHAEREQFLTGLRGLPIN
jgi:hypothetical protein